jgi:hypothetical protein
MKGTQRMEEYMPLHQDAFSRSPALKKWVLGLWEAFARVFVGRRCCSSSMLERQKS